MRIAVVGGGISGMMSWYLLQQKHDVTLFEANDYLGGHTATVQVNVAGQDYAIDTGFIVFNDWTYPIFNRFLSELGVAFQPTEMSFSVKNSAQNLEYNVILFVLTGSVSNYWPRTMLILIWLWGISSLSMGLVLQYVIITCYQWEQLYGLRAWLTCLRFRYAFSCVFLITTVC